MAAGCPAAIEEEASAWKRGGNPPIPGGGAKKWNQRVLHPFLSFADIQSILHLSLSLWLNNSNNTAGSSQKTATPRGAVKRPPTCCGEQGG